MLIALTRPVSPSIDRCELTHLAREPIDVARAVRQHEQYEQALVAAGCEVVRVPAEPDLPDAVFVEDAAVVFEELAVVARPGAASRLPEVASVVAALAPHRALRAIEPPGTLDGGDVLVMGKRVWVGVGGRTSADGVRQLAALIQPHGYAVEPVVARGCLHLKSAATAVAPTMVLLNPAWVDPTAFGGVECLAVDPAEPVAANALLLGSRVLYGAQYPRTRERLLARGLDVATVDLTELAKAEGALTCCSVVFTARQQGA